MSVSHETPSDVTPRRGAIFTWGYQGSTPAKLLELCRALKITMVVDCRRKPASRIPGFSGKALIALFSPPDVPAYVQMGDRLGGVPASAAWPADGKPPPVDTRALQQLSYERACGQRLLLLCMERAPGDCHRHMTIALPLARAGVEVLHVFEGELVEALELQRAIDDPDPEAEYECTPIEAAP